MTKREKIIAICFCFSMTLMIFSSVYTIVSNKPEGYIFRFQKIYNDIKNK